MLVRSERPAERRERAAATSARLRRFAFGAELFSVELPTLVAFVRERALCFGDAQSVTKKGCANACATFAVAQAARLAHGDGCGTGALKRKLCLLEEARASFRSSSLCLRAEEEALALASDQLLIASTTCALMAHELGLEAEKEGALACFEALVASPPLAAQSVTRDMTPGTVRGELVFAGFDPFGKAALAASEIWCAVDEATEFLSTSSSGVFQRPCKRRMCAAQRKELAQHSTVGDVIACARMRLLLAACTRRALRVLGELSDSALHSAGVHCAAKESHLNAKENLTARDTEASKISALPVGDFPGVTASVLNGLLRKNARFPSPRDEVAEVQALRTPSAAKGVWASARLALEEEMERGFRDCPPLDCSVRRTFDELHLGKNSGGHGGAALCFAEVILRRALGFMEQVAEVKSPCATMEDVKAAAKRALSARTSSSKKRKRGEHQPRSTSGWACAQTASGDDVCSLSLLGAPSLMGDSVQRVRLVALRGAMCARRAGRRGQGVWDKLWTSMPTRPSGHKAAKEKSEKLNEEVEEEEEEEWEEEEDEEGEGNKEKMKKKEKKKQKQKRRKDPAAAGIPLHAALVACLAVCPAEAKSLLQVAQTHAMQVRRANLEADRSTGEEAGKGGERRQGGGPSVVSGKRMRIGELWEGGEQWQPCKVKLDRGAMAQCFPRAGVFSADVGVYLRPFAPSSCSR